MVKLRAPRGYKQVLEAVSVHLCHWVRLSTLGTAATIWPVVPAPDDI
jgi:hypothetical protein